MLTWKCPECGYEGNDTTICGCCGYNFHSQEPPTSDSPVERIVSENDICAILFEDAEVKPELFTSGVAALEAFEKYKNRWACHIFVKVSR